jgi:hypothetical protein
VISVSATLVPCLCADSRLVWSGLVWSGLVGPGQPLRGCPAASWWRPPSRVGLRPGRFAAWPVPRVSACGCGPEAVASRPEPPAFAGGSAHVAGTPASSRRARIVRSSCSRSSCTREGMLRSCARTACLKRLTTCDQACGALSVGIPNSPEFTVFGAILVVSWSLPPISARSTTTGCGVKMTPQPSRYGGLSR